MTNSPSDPRNPTKDGDDAHEAKVVATFPDTLTYSAYRELKAFPVSVALDPPGGANPRCGEGTRCDLVFLSLIHISEPTRPSP